MMHEHRNGGTLLLSLALCGSMVAPSCERPAPGAPPPPPVRVAKPERRDVRASRVFVGRTESSEFVEIRARVEGFLQPLGGGGEEGAPVEKEKFGTDVQAGALLFRIEPDEFEARAERARAALAVNQAELERAQADLERVQQAVQTNAVSQSEVSMRQADRDKAAASVEAAKAEVRKAELDLSYTEVRSPIDGRVGRQYVTPGNLVGAGEQTLLTTVAALKPIWVYFELPEQILTDYLRRTSAASMDQDELKERFPVRAQTQSDDDFPHEGWIDYFSNTVNPETGTVEARATFPNDDVKLYPGLFVRVRMEGQPIENAVLVDEAAIGTDLGGKFVLVIEPKEGLPEGQGMVVSRRVELGPQIGSQRVIESGLEGDEEYVVEGLVRARPGLPVRILPGEESDSTNQPEER